MNEERKAGGEKKTDSIIIRTVEGKSIRVELYPTEDSVFPEPSAPNSVAALRVRVAEELSKPGVYTSSTSGAGGSSDSVDPSRVKMLWRGRMLKDESPLTEYMGLVDDLKSNEPPILHVVLQMYQTANGSTTPNKAIMSKQQSTPKHLCKLYKIARNAATCDVCSLPGLNETWCCSTCNYDECKTCFEARKSLYFKEDESQDEDEEEEEEEENETEENSDLPPPLIPLQPITSESETGTDASTSTAPTARSVPTPFNLPTAATPHLTAEQMRRWASIGAPSSNSNRGPPTSCGLDTANNVEEHSPTTSTSTTPTAASITSRAPSRKLPYVPAFNVLNLLGVRNNTPSPPTHAASSSTPSSQLSSPALMEAMTALINQANAIQESVRKLGDLHAQQHVFFGQIQASSSSTLTSEQLTSLNEGHLQLQQAMAQQREALGSVSHRIATIAGDLGRVMGPQPLISSLPQVTGQSPPQTSVHTIHIGPGGVSHIGPGGVSHPTSGVNPLMQMFGGSGGQMFGPGSPHIITPSMFPAGMFPPGMFSAQPGLHCMHCRGYPGVCACAFRCPRQDGTQCIALGQLTGAGGTSASSSSVTRPAAPTPAPSSSATPTATAPATMPAATPATMPSTTPTAQSTSAVTMPATSMQSTTTQPDDRLSRAERRIQELTDSLSFVQGVITSVQSGAVLDRSRLQNLESQFATLQINPGSGTGGSNRSSGAGGPTDGGNGNVGNSVGDSAVPALRPRGSPVIVSDPVGLTISSYSSPGLLQLAILYRSLVGGDRVFDSSESNEIQPSSGFSVANATAIKDRIRALNTEERAGLDRILKGIVSKPRTSATTSSVASVASPPPTSSSIPPVVLRSGFLSGRG
jgi:hypothetical protein